MEELTDLNRFQVSIFLVSGSGFSFHSCKGLGTDGFGLGLASAGRLEPPAQLHFDMFTLSA